MGFPPFFNTKKSLIIFPTMNRDNAPNIELNVDVNVNSDDSQLGNASPISPLIWDPDMDIGKYVDLKQNGHINSPEYKRLTRRAPGRKRGRWTRYADNPQNKAIGRAGLTKKPPCETWVALQDPPPPPPPAPAALPAPAQVLPPAPAQVLPPAIPQPAPQPDPVFLQGLVNNHNWNPGVINQ